MPDSILIVEDEQAIAAFIQTSKAMAKNPADRFQTVHEMVKAFSAAVAASPQALPAGTESAPQVTITPRLDSRQPTPSRRKMGWIWAAAGVGTLGPTCIIALVLTPALSPIRVRVQDGQVQLIRTWMSGPISVLISTGHRW